MIYFIIWAVVNVLGLGVILTKHGEPEKGKHNFHYSFIVNAILVWLMYMWGAFDNLFGVTR